ncbi:molecular chaperone GrpE [Undibacterium sp. GrIS 1.8]|uniref:nucleotide exchange factor GrpE n=1 Tax=Undibacterium sp. GrIS 1.8 TaxID=3143934 RepID=UPI0033949877
MQEQEKPSEVTDPEESVVSEIPQDAAAAQEPVVDTLAQLEAKVSELQDAFMRAKAEGENIRRRAQEDIAKAHKFAIESFAEAMVPVKDSLEMALKIETPSIDSLKEGVEMTLKQLSSAFEKNRLLEISPVTGDKLDPNKHQAISMVPAEQDANTVVTVLQKGYTIADRLLRPALVTVAQAK